MVVPPTMNNFTTTSACQMLCWHVPGCASMPPESTTTPAESACPPPPGAAHLPCFPPYPSPNTPACLPSPAK